MNFKIIKIILGLLFFTLSLTAFTSDELSEPMDKGRDEKLSLAIELFKSNDIQKVARGVVTLEDVAQNEPKFYPAIWSYYAEQADMQPDYPNLEKIVYWGEKLQEIDLTPPIHEATDVLLLALIYRFDEEHGYKDIDKSNKYFKKLYDISLINNYESYLENIYLTGYGVEQDFDKAWNLYIKKSLVEDGESELMINTIKEIYQENINIEKDKKMRWLGPSGTLKGYFELTKELKMKELGTK